VMEVMGVEECVSVRCAISESNRVSVRLLG